MLFWFTVSQDFKTIRHGGLEWIECVALARIPWLVHAFSTRRGGVGVVPSDVPGTNALNLGVLEWDKRANVEKNRQLFLQGIGAEGFTLSMLHQVHSAKVFRATRGSEGAIEYRPAGVFQPGECGEPFPADEGKRLEIRDSPSRESPIPSLKLTTSDLPAGDALLSEEPGILLSVRTADCLPVLLVDSGRHAVAAVHAGWRGALARIMEATVAHMRRLFGTRPEDLVAAIGPSIRACCYEVGEDVAEAFRARFLSAGSRTIDTFFREPPPGQRTSPAGISGVSLVRSPPSMPPGHSPRGAYPVHLDLVAVARYQLQAAGVRPPQVYVAEFCTACRTDLFFSYRKQGALAGRMMAVVGSKALGR
jgi:polyphenol oxidase